MQRTRWSWLLVACVGCSSSEPTATQDSGNADVGAESSADMGTDSVVSPIDLQIDTYNVGLAGVGVPREAERRMVQLVELAKLTGDLLCLQEAWQESDKTALKTALAAHYPYAAWPKTDRSTKIDGTVTPPVPTSAPCAGFETQLDAAITCLSTSCKAADGKLTTTACAQEMCLADVTPLLGAADKSCYACLVSNMVSEPLSSVASVCKAPGLGLGFGGQASQMLLSKHPLEDVSQLVVPGCWQQRSVIHAVASLENGAKLDVYCNHLSPVNASTLLPYSCPWNAGETANAKAWEAEQKLQIDAILAFAKGAKNRVVFLGDFNASPAVASPPAAPAAIDGYGAYVLDVLGKTYTQALTADFAPKCTFCNTNPLTDGSENTWLDHIFLGGIDGKHVKSSSRTFDTKVVPAAAPDTFMSDHFGMRAVVTIDP